MQARQAGHARAPLEEFLLVLQDVAADVIVANALGFICQILARTKDCGGL